MLKHGENFSERLAYYLDGIKDSGGLTREEETELGKRIEAGDRYAVDELFRANLQYPVSVAKAYTTYGVPIDDLVSEANFGLYHAAETFDYKKGTKFITHAMWWIRSSIQNAIRRYRCNGRQVYMDDYIKEKDGDHVGTYSEMAELVNNEYEEKLADIQSRGAVVDELMQCLQERESKILSLYFGLHGYPELSLKEISKEFNLSSERVRQIVDTSITKMKAAALSGGSFSEYKEIF